MGILADFLAIALGGLFGGLFRSKLSIKGNVIFGIGVMLISAVGIIENIFNVTDKRLESSDRATLINVLLTTDGYTVGTGIMPSALNNGKIVCVPFESEDFYHIGYICRADRKRSALTERFIALLDAFAEQYR